MSPTIELSLACGDYEIMRALKEGVVRPDGIDLKVLTDMDSPTRHWRFLRNGEFDVAEVSCSSYIAARDQGLPFRAIPVFPHRRFRHGFAYINTAAGITKPADLIGRKVGVKFFLISAALWMRGILEHEYGVPFRSMEWFTELDEDVDFTPPADLKITRIPPSKSIISMLVDGELDMLLHADIIQPLRRAPVPVYLAIFLENACWMQVLAESAGGPKLVSSPEEAHAKKRISRPENQVNLFNYMVRRVHRAR